MSTTPNMGMTELSNNSGQYLVMNADLALIDQMLVPVVADKDRTTPPGSPADGAMYIMATAWSGLTLTSGSPVVANGRLVYWRASANAWTVIVPKVGWRVAVADEVDANGFPRIYGCSASGATSTWTLPESSLTNPMTTLGDIIVAGASGVPGRLAVGAAGSQLQSDGSTALWADPTALVSKSADYTFVLSDRNGSFVHPSADTTNRTFTIPANSAVAYPVGTYLTIHNLNAAGAVTIAINTDTMRVTTSGATGARTLAANGIATIRKVATTEWQITGVNLT
ncbi:DUF2793 domain-containing protein [Pseudomonas nitroreducens]|uniref:DUF2793 domain-containing protein n=1 Tax=Pseudomonas nitroreducens TaxID=46680 RepID=UPI00351D4177